MAQAKKNKNQVAQSILSQVQIPLDLNSLVGLVIFRIQGLNLKGIWNSAFGSYLEKKEENGFSNENDNKVSVKGNRYQLET